MPITKIFSYLTQPAADTNPQPAISGANVPLKGLLHRMLTNVFEKADNECDTEIAFNPAGDGRQTNPCRDMITALLRKPTLAAGRKLAARLQSSTTNKSGLGLLFVVIGGDSSQSKLVLSRFPADQGVLAESQKHGLKVQFVEKVFMKNATSYKAVVYTGASFESDFWSGYVVDRQINSRLGAVSDYWIRDFLDSELKTNSALGTRRLANALREASRVARLPIKQEIAAAIQLAKNLDGRTTSFNGFLNEFHLSDDAKQEVLDHLPNGYVGSDRFRFSRTEFQTQIPFRSIELNTGAMLTAPADRFDKCFKERKGEGQNVEYTAAGKIVDERVRKQK